VNVGKKSTFDKARRIDVFGRDRLMAMLSHDNEPRKAKPALAPLSFTKRTLPGEAAWAREQIQRKVVE
jgi:hypothetical protein